MKERDDGKKLIGVIQLDDVFEVESDTAAIKAEARPVKRRLLLPLP